LKHTVDSLPCDWEALDNDRQRYRNVSRQTGQKHPTSLNEYRPKFMLTAYIRIREIIQVRPHSYSETPRCRACCEKNM